MLCYLTIIYKRGSRRHRSSYVCVHIRSVFRTNTGGYKIEYVIVTGLLKSAPDLTNVTQLSLCIMNTWRVFWPSFIYAAIYTYSMGGGWPGMGVSGDGGGSIHHQSRVLWKRLAFLQPFPPNDTVDTSMEIASGNDKPLVGNTPKYIPVGSVRN